MRVCISFCIWLLTCLYMTMALSLLFIILGVHCRGLLLLPRLSLTAGFLGVIGMDFFQPTALCTSELFITSGRPGYFRSFQIFSNTNLALACTTGLAHIPVYLSLHKLRHTFIQRPTQSKELGSTRRLPSLSVIETLQWLILGFTGVVVAARGDELGVGLKGAIPTVELPVLWTVRTAVYPLSTLRERRRRRQEDRLMRMIAARLVQRKTG